MDEKTKLDSILALDKDSLLKSAENTMLIAINKLIVDPNSSLRLATRLMAIAADIQQLRKELKNDVH